MTIAEQFYHEWQQDDDSSPVMATKHAIERIEACMDHYRADYDTIISEMARNMRGLEERITALENMQSGIMKRSGESFSGLTERIEALEHPQAKVGEWIDIADRDNQYWIYYSIDGTLLKGCLSDYVKGYTHIMPYIPGMEKPQPPEVTK